jgi:hypothetical protein
MAESEPMSLLLTRRSTCKGSRGTKRTALAGNNVGSSAFRISLDSCSCILPCALQLPDPKRERESSPNPSGSPTVVSDSDGHWRTEDHATVRLPPRFPGAAGLLVFRARKRDPSFRASNSHLPGAHPRANPNPVWWAQWVMEQGRVVRNNLDRKEKFHEREQLLLTRLRRVMAQANLSNGMTRSRSRTQDQG